MRSWTTFMLCCTVFFLFADQNLLAPNLTAVARDFGMDDQERDEKLGGWIAFGFFIVGGPVALLVGYFTDTVNRAVLFGVVVFLGESACLGTYWVTTYQQLFLCRVLTGISVGGATPVIFSMIGDLYPGDSRVYASTLVGVS
ncbi:major facilitator superfamily domain-containing protein, partial [Ochromonadaceae sp. CCMP2298]